MRVLYGHEHSNWNVGDRVVLQEPCKKSYEESGKKTIKVSFVEREVALPIVPHERLVEKHKACVAGQKNFQESDVVVCHHYLFYLK